MVYYETVWTEIKPNVPDLDPNWITFRCFFSLSHRLTNQTKSDTQIDLWISPTVKSQPLYQLGPNKHRLVTYIQVNVYIGNTLSWAFKTDVCWRINNHISIISLHVFEFSSKNNGLSAVCDCGISWSYSLTIFNILSLRLYCYIYWKFIRLYE